MYCGFVFITLKYLKRGKGGAGKKILIVQEVPLISPAICLSEDGNFFFCQTRVFLLPLDGIRELFTACHSRDICEG